MPDPVADRRGTFGPVVAAAVAAAALAAVASARPWFSGSDAAAPRVPVLPDVAPAGEMPLAAAVSLVVLAAWGVVLVTRGAVRRGAAVLALLAAGGLVATVVAGWLTLPREVADAVRSATATDTTAVAPTGWFWVAAGTAALLVPAGVLAVLWCRSWPEMGSRYDAPGTTGAASAEVPPEERTHLDLWKQLDEGRDPTT